MQVGGWLSAEAAGARRLGSAGNRGRFSGQSPQLDEDVASNCKDLDPLGLGGGSEPGPSIRYDDA